MVKTPAYLAFAGPCLRTLWGSVSVNRHVIMIETNICFAVADTMARLITEKALHICLANHTSVCDKFYLDLSPINHFPLLGAFPRRVAKLIALLD